MASWTSFLSAMENSPWWFAGTLAMIAWVVYHGPKWLKIILDYRYKKHKLDAELAERHRHLLVQTSEKKAKNRQAERK